MSDYRLDQSARNTGPSGARPDIHAPQQTLVRLLLSLSDGQSGNSQDLGIEKCAKHLRTAQPVEKPSQRPGKFGLKGAAEGFRALFEARQTDAAVQGGVPWGQLANVNVGGVQTYLLRFDLAAVALIVRRPSVATDLIGTTYLWQFYARPRRDVKIGPDRTLLLRGFIGC